MEKKVFLGFIEDLLINTIRIFKDESYQRKIWFRREGPEVDSYIDTISHFIKLCDSLFKDPTCTLYLGEENSVLLKKLYTLVIEHLDLTEERVGDTYNLQENELLDNPNWHDIQSLSEEIDNRLTFLLDRSKDE